MGRIAVFSLAACLIVAFSGFARGDIITYNNRAAWEAALFGGPDYVEGFDAYNGLSYDSSPITTPNFVLSSLTNNANNVISLGPMSTPGPHMLAWLRAVVPNHDSRLTFSSPLSAWGSDMRVVNLMRLTLYDSSGALGTFQPNTDPSPAQVFFGVIGTAGEQITRVEFGTGGLSFGTVNYFDNVSGKAFVEVPEPSSLGFILGIALFYGARRARRR